jgi:hypothetical protein
MRGVRIEEGMREEGTEESGGTKKKDREEGTEESIVNQREEVRAEGTEESV